MAPVQQFRRQSETLPRHVAIIMDGNGRWARKRHLPRAAGHVAGRGGRARPSFARPATSGSQI